VLWAILVALLKVQWVDQALQEIQQEAQVDLVTLWEQDLEVQEATQEVILQNKKLNDKNFNFYFCFI
jgi:hypothetical protein